MPLHVQSILLYHALIDKGLYVCAFWDNDDSLCGNSYNGTRIMLPVSFDSIDDDVTIIVYSRKYESEIYQQLISLGCSAFISAYTLDLSDIQRFSRHIVEEDFIRIVPENKRSLHKCFFYADSKDCYQLASASSIISTIVKVTDTTKKKAGSRRILLISHDIDLYGAPIALQNAAKAIMEYGDIPILCSRTNGSLLPSLLKDGIPVLIDQYLFDREFFLQLLTIMDIVLVNTFTAQSLDAIALLNGLSIPVLWWIHECNAYCSLVPHDRIPDTIEENIHIYCVGEYAQVSLLRVQPNFSTSILLYGIVDFNTDIYSDHQFASDRRLQIITVGGFSVIKGQDIFCEAVRKMNPDLRGKCDFVFVGRPDPSNKMYLDVMALKSEYPDHIEIAGEVAREKMNEILLQCDCMVCASRDDTMPMFIAEAMMFRKVCICSENTGFESLIEDGINGFTYSRNSADELCKKLEYYVRYSANLKDMKKKSRKTYDEYFAFPMFSNNLMGILNTI